MNATLKPVEKIRAYENIVQQILSLLRDGILKHDDQLPAERELAKILKVSRETVREAIRTLELRNVLQSRQGSGTYIIAARE